MAARVLCKLAGSGYFRGDFLLPRVHARSARGQPSSGIFLQNRNLYQVGESTELLRTESVLIVELAIEGNAFISVKEQSAKPLLLDAFGKPNYGISCPDSSGNSSGSCARYDLNAQDSFINVSDLLIMIGPDAFGKPIDDQGCATADDGLLHCCLP